MIPKMGINSPTFLAERQRLLAKLDTHMTSLTRKGIGFPDHPNLKRALGITDAVILHDFARLCAIPLRDGCDLLDVIGRRLQAQISK